MCTLRQVRQFEQTGERAAAPCGPSPAVNTGCYMAESRRILVVDDDADIRALLVRYFGDAGHEVRTAPDGRQGLDLVRTWVPDIVLLDLEMPAMNGLDVLRHIEADHAGVPVVAFSGHAVAERLGEDARRLGAREFLVKPFDLEDLGQAVDNALAPPGS